MMVRNVTGNVFAQASVLLWCVALIGATCGASTLVAAIDPSIVYSGYVTEQFVPDPTASDRVMARFDRQFDIPGKGYRWDNPGVSIRFRTDSTLVVAHLYYNELHTSKSARNSRGVYAVDGIFLSTRTFQTQQTTVLRSPEPVNVTMSSGITAGLHDYEIYLPYGDSVDFAGVEVNQGAKLVPPGSTSTVLYLAYGDSITHGFSATGIDKTYPFLLAKAKGWRLLNLGLGGRASNVPDGRLIGSLPADIITVLMGVNDWQAGARLEQTRGNMMGFIDKIRAMHAATPIYIITPLWVAPSWKPAGAIVDLDGYRQVLRDIVAARNDANLHVVEGPSLIDHDPALFDTVAVHPNDAGFAMMSTRLAQCVGNPVNER